MNIVVGIILTIAAVIAVLSFVWIAMCCLFAFTKGMQVLLAKVTAPADKKYRLKEIQAT